MTPPPVLVDKGNPPTPDSAATAKLNAKLDSLNLGDFNVTNATYEEVLALITAKTKASDPEGVGIKFDILTPLKPSGASSSTIRMNVKGLTVRKFLENESQYGCFQYEISGDAVKVWWISEVQATLRVAMERVSIQLDFEKTDVATALKTLQAEARKNGIELPLHVEASKDLSPMVTLHLGPINLQQALNAVCYQAHYKIIPWRKDVAGYDLVALPPGELPLSDFMKFEITGYQFRHNPDDAGQESRVQAAIAAGSESDMAKEKVTVVGNASTVLWGTPMRLDFYPHSAILDLPLEKNNPGSKASFRFRIFADLKRYNEIDFTGSMGIADGDGLTRSMINGGWSKTAGSSVLITYQGKRGLNTPLSANVGRDQMEYLMVVKTSLIDEMGKTLVPTSEKMETVEGRSAFSDNWEAPEPREPASIPGPVMTGTRIATVSAMTEEEAQKQGIAAIVNHHPVYWAEVIYDRISPWPRLKKKYSGEELKKAVAQEWLMMRDFFIFRELTIQEAEATGYQTPKSVVDGQVAFGVKGFGGDKAKFVENLQKNGLTLDQFIKLCWDNDMSQHMDTIEVFNPAMIYAKEHGHTSEEWRNAMMSEENRLTNERNAHLEAKAEIQRFGLPEFLANE